MSREKSFRMPPIARYELPLERDRKKDVFRNKNRLIEISSTVVKAAPGQKSGFFMASVDTKKRTILLDEADTGIDRKLTLRRILSEDMNLELTNLGPRLYLNTGKEGITGYHFLQFPTHFLEITSQKARHILPKLSDDPVHPLYFYKIYAVISGNKTPIQKVSLVLLRKILTAEKEGRLFFGRRNVFDPNAIDQVRVVEH